MRVCTATVHRQVQRLGYRYRRPRHDLRHRQDAEAVAAAKHVLAELQKRGCLPGLDSGLFTWMSATCTPIPTWQRSGSGAVPADEGAGRGGRSAYRRLWRVWTMPRGRCCGRRAVTKDGAGFAAFLAQIGQTWPDDDLVLVLDNVSYHRSAAMRTWWAAQEGRMLPFWLPAYAPNLNLLERVWRFLKQKLACHCACGPIATGSSTPRAPCSTRPRPASIPRIDQPFASDTMCVNPLRVVVILNGRETACALLRHFMPSTDYSAASALNGCTRAASTAVMGTTYDVGCWLGGGGSRSTTK